MMFSAGISGGKSGQRILRHCMKRKALPSCLPIAHMMPIMVIVDMLGADTRKKKRAKHIVRTLSEKSGNISDKLSEKESSPSEIDTQNLPG